jgi:hypothetical protein
VHLTESIRAAADDHNIAATRQELSEAEQAAFDLYGYDGQLDMSRRMRGGQSALDALDGYGREHGVPVARDRFTDLEGFERAYGQARGDILEANGVARDAPATRLKNGSVVLWGRTGADSSWTRVTDTNLTDMRSHVRASQETARWEYQVRPANEPAAPPAPSRVEHEPPAAEQRVASIVGTHFREFRQAPQRDPTVDADERRHDHMENAAGDAFMQSLGGTWSQALGEYADRLQVDALAPALVAARAEARDAVARFPPTRRAERLNRHHTTEQGQTSVRDNDSAHDPAQPGTGVASAGPAIR